MRGVTISPLAAYLPYDRRVALARGETLPEHTRGAALFADISGFTALTESLVQSLGAARGAEELMRQVNAVYDALIAHVHAYRGSVIGFAGDAVTCFFEEKYQGISSKSDTDTANSYFLLPASSFRAVACALAMQTAMRAFPQLAIKIGVATGPARRFVVGDPQIGLIDTLAGETIRQMARAQALAAQGEVVLAASALNVIASKAKQSPIRSTEIPSDYAQGGALDENRPRNDTNAPFAILHELTTPIDPAPWEELPADALSDTQIRPWILPALYERLAAGQEQFTLELRAATALFVQFQELDYDHDAEAGAKLDAYIRHAQRVLQRYDGNIIQLTIGDKGSFFYVVFGAPIAHDDDPYRAIQAARDLISHPQSLISKSIGIAGGQMRVGAYGSAARRAYGAIGNATNLAARLMQAARSGEIHCDYNVYRAASKRVAFEALLPIRVKGKVGLVRVYRPTLETPRRVVSTAAIIGRRAEIAAIEKLLDDVQAGATRVLIIEGEAGIGKSRLVDELKRTARERGLTGLLGAGQSIEQQTPYGAWRDVFNSYFDLDHVTTASERRARVKALALQIIPEHAQRFPVLNDVLGLDIPENDLTQSLDANLRQQNVMLVLTALVRAWTNERPLILVLEDAHWLDSLSWQLVAHLVRALALTNAPLLCVLVNRPLGEDSADQKVFAELRARNLTQSLTLSALAPDEIVALIANRLNVAPDALPAPLVELVQARANGNPFFAEELVFNLRDHRIITVDTSTEDAPRIALTSDLETAQRALPDTLHGLILARIDRLPPERQFVVKVATVIGRAFAFAPLHHVVTRYMTMSAASLNDHLTALTKADFTFLETLEPDLTYLFKHIITQEGAYQTLLFAQRRELHRAVAEWYESSGEWSVVGGQKISSLPTVHYPLLAHHYRYAEVVEKERHYARLAGEAAAKVYANDAAVSYLSRALELTPADDVAARRDLLLAREAIYHVQGKRPAQAADLDALAQIDEARTQAQVWLRRARLAVETGDYAAAVMHAQATREAALRAHAEALAVAGEIEWGRALARQAKHTEARERLAHALAHAQGVAPELQPDCFHVLGMILSEQGEYAQAQNYFEQALQLRQTSGDRRGEGNVLHSLGNIALFRADYARASECYQNAIAIFRLIGARADEGTTLGNLGTVALYQADYAQAASCYTTALLIARETGNRRGESNMLGNLGIVARYRGEYARAIAYAEQSIAIDRALGHQQGIGRGLSSLGETARMMGDYARAQEYYTQAVTLARAAGVRRSESIALGNLGLVALAQHEYARAVEYCAAALALARQLGDRDRIGYALDGLANALLAVGKAYDAQAAMQQAIALRRELGQAALTMESMAGLARIYLAQDKFAEAQTVVQDILAYWDRTHSFDAANEPLQILFTCYRALAASSHARASEILQAAFEHLRHRLAQIPDSAMRRATLARVPHYREILAAYAAYTQMPLDQAIDAAMNAR